MKTWHMRRWVDLELQVLVQTAPGAQPGDSFATYDWKPDGTAEPHQFHTHLDAVRVRDRIGCGLIIPTGEPPERDDTPEELARLDPKRPPRATRSSWMQDWEREHEG